MTQVWDEKAKATAIKAALTAAMPASVFVGDEDELPATRPQLFVTIDIERAFVETRRLGGFVAAPGGHLWVRYGARGVGGVDNVREMRKRATAALEGVALPNADAPVVGPFTFYASLPLDAPDGWFESADDFTF